MIESMTQGVNELIERGGWVAWPLLVLSVISLMLIFERICFWVITNHPWRIAKVNKAISLAREHKQDQALQLMASDTTVYGDMFRHLLTQRASEALALQAIERERSPMERFMPMLGTLITAAPMLGILGTVSGIISAFKILSEKEAVTDPSLIGSGIAEALLTTVAGLVVALIILFPFNAFKAQIDRTLGRLESIAANVIESSTEGE